MLLVKTLAIGEALPPLPAPFGCTGGLGFSPELALKPYPDLQAGSCSGHNPVQRQQQLGPQQFSCHNSKST